MQDLTTGSLTGHLLKTTSFMLVSMIFQTLYILVDLFWVGRLGTDAIAAVGLAGNLSFIVIAITQVLGVGATTWSRMRRAEGPGPRDFPVSTSQGAVDGRGGDHPADRQGCALNMPRPERDRRHGIATEQLLLWFIRPMALRLRWSPWGGTPRHGHFKPGRSGTTRPS